MEVVWLQTLVPLNPVNDVHRSLHRFFVVAPLNLFVVLGIL